MAARSKAGNSKSAQDVELESGIRALQKSFESRGIRVRREKLCTGPSFKVKSGNCVFSGENFIFVDRRLSSDQQLSVLLEYLTDTSLELTDDELENIPPHTRNTIISRRSTFARQSA